MENSNRNVFSLDGLNGLTILTVVLLAILVILGYYGIKIQKDVVNKPYKLIDPSRIEKISKDNITHKEIVK